VIRTTIVTVTTSRPACGTLNFVCFADHHAWVASAIGAGVSVAASLVLALAAYQGARRAREARDKITAGMLADPVKRCELMFDKLWESVGELAPMASWPYPAVVQAKELIAEVDECIEQIKDLTIEGDVYLSNLKVTVLGHLRSAKRDLTTAAAGAAVGETRSNLALHSAPLKQIVAALRRKTRLIRFTNGKGRLIIPK